MKKITPTEYSLKIKSAIFTPRELSDAMLVGAKQLEASVKTRVFNDGIATSGQAIGNYKSYKLYANRSKFIRKSLFRPTPPTRKTMTFQGGWQGLRRYQGLSTDRVNLSYSGALQLSIQTFAEGNDAVLAIASKDGKEKRENMERLYGQVFTPSTKDVAQFSAAVDAYFLRVTANKLK